MINNNNLQGNPKNRIPTKTDLQTMVYLSVFSMFIALVKSNNQTASIIIALLGVFALVILCVTKISRKNLTQAEVYKYFGVLGIIGAVIMAGMFSVSIATSYQGCVNIFVLFLIAQILITALMEFKYGKKLSHKKIQKNALTVSMVVPFAALGVYLGKYIDSADTKTFILLMMFLFWLMYVLFYPYLIKYRNIIKNNQGTHNTGDSSLC